MEQAKRARRALCMLLAYALLLTVAAGCGGKQPEDSQRPKIMYAVDGVTTAEDPDALQNAVDEMYEKAGKPGVSLEYKNGANSEDGTNFSCYIANADANAFDMFIALYADAEMTDELFVSGLLRPGTAFETVSLKRALASGTQTVYCAFTQVEDDLETIHAQIVVTMEFTVSVPS